MSKAEQLALALSASAGQISVANGYQTDIGLRVFRGKRRLAESDIPCVVLVEDDDEGKSTSVKNCQISARYLLEGHMACDPDHPNDTGHKIVADLKRAVFSGDLSFEKQAIACRYHGRVIDPRTDGLSLIAAHIEIEIEFVEDLSNP